MNIQVVGVVGAGVMGIGVKTKIKTFLAQFFGNHELQDDEDIFATNFVNSMFAMQLVLFIENEFQVTVENEDLD